MSSNSLAQKSAIPPLPSLTFFGSALSPLISGRLEQSKRGRDSGEQRQARFCGSLALLPHLGTLIERQSRRTG